MTITLDGFDHQVAWREFSRVEERRGNSSEDAFVAARTHLAYDWTEESDGTWRVTDVRANIVVNGADSWVVHGRENATLLRHEQGHFDITALGLREEASLVSDIAESTLRRLRRRRGEVREEIQSKINEANQRYDTRTEHSRNQTAQRRWLDAIAAAKGSGTGTIDDLPD